MSIHQAKHDLRSEMLHELELLIPHELAVLSQAICAQVVLFLKGKPALRIACFAARSWEVNLIPLLTLLPHHEWYFPRSLDHHQLSFHRIWQQEELTRGRYKILEPDSYAPTIEADQLDLILLPGSAFDRSGHRLGYGGGFYDHFLPMAHQAVKVGVCFPQQVVHKVPTHPHDMPVQYLLTGQDASETTHPCPASGFDASTESFAH